MKIIYTLIATLSCILMLFSLSIVQAEVSSGQNNSSYTNKYYWIIYDNVCPYCRQATKYIKELDWEGKFKFLSYRDPLTYEMFPNLTKEECEKKVHLVTPKKEVLSGYKVFRFVIDNLAATKIFNPLLKNDFAEKKLNEIYEKMLHERSCYYKKSGTCSLEDVHNPNSKNSENQ